MAKGTVKKVDFDKARKRRQRVANLKRIGVLAAIAVAVALVIALNNIMVNEGITNRINDLISGYGGSGYPVPLPGGVIREVKHTGKDLLVLNDTNLYIYSKKGKLVNSVQRMSDSTVLLVGDNRSLTYDPSGGSYRIHSRSKTLFEGSAEEGVITADMNRQGDYVVSMDAKQRACEVRAYNQKFKEIYICKFAEHQISSVAIAPKGLSMAAGYITTQDGMIFSGINFYLFSNDKEPVGTLSLPDEMLLDLQYYEDDRIGVLTDRQYRIVDMRGEVKGSYSFSGLALAGCERQGKQVLLHYENRETRTRTLVLLDEYCEPRAVWETGERIVDLALGAKQIYVLTEQDINTFTTDFVLEDSFPVRFVSAIHLTREGLYYLTKDDICLLGQEKDTPESTGTVTEGSSSQDTEPEGSAAEPEESSADRQESSADEASGGEEPAEEDPAEEEPADEEG